MNCLREPIFLWGVCAWKVKRKPIIQGFVTVPAVSSRYSKSLKDHAASSWFPLRLSRMAVCVTNSNNVRGYSNSLLCLRLEPCCECCARHPLPFSRSFPAPAGLLLCFRHFISVGLIHYYSFTVPRLQSFLSPHTARSKGWAKDSSTAKIKENTNKLWDYKPCEFSG